MRDWLLQWVRSTAGAGKKDRRRGRSRPDDDADDSTSAAGGCMCAAAAVFHLFDAQFPLNHRLEDGDDEITPPPFSNKGVEAPRNSLEIYDDEDSNSVAVKEEKNNNNHLHLPVISNIKTKPPPSSSICSSSNNTMIDSSPRTAKTPSLVARLMGLDLFPDQEHCTISSTSPSLLHPSSSCSNSKKPVRDNRRASSFQARSKGFFEEEDDDVSMRSLPETSRPSSSSTVVRKSDGECYYNHHHRLSLNEERKAGRFIDHDNNSEESPRSSSYAKKIVKNFKESVMNGRRVGLLADITNNNDVVEDRRSPRRDQNLIVLAETKNKNKNKVVSRTDDHCCKEEERSRSLGAKSPKLSSSSSSSLSGEKKEVIAGNKLTSKPCNNPSDNRASEHHHAMNKNKKEAEKFVGTSAAKTANKKTVLKQVKKDPSPSPTKLPQKQVTSADALASKRSTRLSSKPSHSTYNKHSNNNNKIILGVRGESVVPPRAGRDDGNVRYSTAGLRRGDAAAEYGEYIQLVLKKACITRRSRKWHGLKQPIDPFIFYLLEHSHYAGGGGGGAELSRRCNRKLIFQLLNELLADTTVHVGIRHMGLKPSMGGEVPLSDELCRKIDNFPAAKCEVLEDIDCLIGGDMFQWESSKFSDEELQSIMSEIESEVVEFLLKDTVVVILEEERIRRR